MPRARRATSSSVDLVLIEALAVDAERVRRRLVDELARTSRSWTSTSQERTQLEPPHGDQPGIAGAGADERDRHRSASSTTALEVVAPLLVGGEAASSPTAGARAAPVRARRARRRSGRPARRAAACASAGDAPPVETASAIGSRRWTAGQDEASRARACRRRCRRSPRASASPKTRRLTARRRRRDRRGSARRGRRSRSPRRPARTGSCAQLGLDLRRDDGDVRPAVEQALHLLQRDLPPPTTRQRRARRGRDRRCSSASRRLRCPRS